MSLLESVGLCALCAALFWPLSYIPWVAEQNAVAVRANAIAQCRGEPMRVVPCDQTEAAK